MDILKVLSARQTSKVIANVADNSQTEPISDEVLDKILEHSGNAPFHYACTRSHKSELLSDVPWRAYKLNRTSCIDMMNVLMQMGDQTKIPNMLAAAQFLVQVTWLPDEGTLLSKKPMKEGVQFEGTLRNMEHIAAASAFVQNLLLAATGTGFRTYWSSGGPLRSQAVFEKLGISENELLLGSIFLFPQEVPFGEVKPGSMVDKRGALEGWSRWCKIT